MNAVVEENDLDVEVPTEEETKEEIETTSNDETPTIEEKEEEIAEILLRML